MLCVLCVCVCMCVCDLTTTADPAFVLPFDYSETQDWYYVQHLTIQVKNNVIFFQNWSIINEF